MASIEKRDMIELVNPANGSTFLVTPKQAAGVYAGFKRPAGPGKPPKKSPTIETGDTDTAAATLEE